MSIKTVDLLNGGDYTDQSPFSLSFYGTEFAFDKWTDLCTKFFEKVQEIYPAKIENLARLDRKHGGLPYLCTINQRNENRSNNPLNRSNIFLYLGYSTNDHIKHIRELIKLCDLDVSKISIRYVSNGTENKSAQTRKVRSVKSTLFDRFPDDSFSLSLKEPYGVVPQNIQNVFITEYSGGFNFSSSALRLLEVSAGCEITEEEQGRLKKKMYRRGDGLYFLHDSIVDRQVRLQICEYVNVALENFHCFELNALYERFGKYFNSVCIRNLEDFEEWFFTNFDGNIKSANCCNVRIIRLKSTKLDDVKTNLIGRIDNELGKACGILEEEKLLAIFHAFSLKFLNELIRQELDDVSIRQINERSCYQTLDALEIPEEFPQELLNALEKIDELELKPDLETINVLVSVALKSNFEKSFNLSNDRTYRKLIEKFYKGSPREWKEKLFRKIDE